MISKSVRELLDNCLILLHDHATLPVTRIDDEALIKLFIRNALKIPSTKRLQEYFDKHVYMKSAIRENKGKRVRDWTKFHNGLKVRKGYENIVPLTLKEQKSIKDARYIKYRILSYEVHHKINGLKSQKYRCFQGDYCGDCITTKHYGSKPE